VIDWLILFVAGFFGGIINSLAGGGSFITFPTLVFMGVPTVIANATNTFSACAGYMSGTFALRRELRAYRSEIPKILGISLIGGGLGAYLLLHTQETTFNQIVPWLLLFATVMFIFGGQLNQALKRMAANNRHSAKLGGLGVLLLALFLLGVSVYGGFFNAGLGIISLSYLALAGYTNINAMNGMKLLISTAVSIVAIVLFILDDKIAWFEGIAVLVGTVTGGYLSAHISTRLPQKAVRYFVIGISLATTLYFFVDVYGAP
jgi:uncharacterized membrane protein YfcA